MSVASAEQAQAEEDEWARTANAVGLDPDDFTEKCRQYSDALYARPKAKAGLVQPTRAADSQEGPGLNECNNLDAAAEGYELVPLDWQALIRDGVPEVEYVLEPYFPKGARVWIWGAAGSFKSVYCQWAGAKLSREGVRVVYFSEENPIAEETRRLSRLQPDPDHFTLYHRSGMDLADADWVTKMLGATQGADIVFFDSWTDLWSGDESDNRAVQQFDARVLKPLQAQEVTPVVLHHTGHKVMFSNRSGATAGRGASSLGQKADVTLEIRGAGDDRFTIVYGKCRIGGVSHPDRTFRAQDTDDERLEIVEAESPEEFAVHELAEQMAQAILTVPQGYLTTNDVKNAVKGGRKRQTAALTPLESDSRVECAIEKVPTRDGKLRDAKVWRPTGTGAVGDGFTLLGDDG